MTPTRQIRFTISQSTLRQIMETEDGGIINIKPESDDSKVNFTITFDADSATELIEPETVEPEPQADIDAPPPYRRLCPICFGPVVSTERCPNGKDTCRNGHTFHRSAAIPYTVNSPHR